MAGLGLIDTTTGLRFGTGLYFEPGLGSDGLTIPDQQPDSAVFAGQGSLSVSAGVLRFAGATFAGSSTLSVTATRGLTARATFPGQGLVSAAGYDGNDTYMEGRGSLRVDTLPLNSYVAENGTTYYVAEDGTTYYVQEN